MKSKLIVLVATLLLTTNLLFSQTDSVSTKFSADFNVDLVSRRMWRGFKSSKSPEIQPTINMNYKNFYFGIWGAYTFTQASKQEIDIWVGYSYKNFTITAYDYWNPSDTLGWKSDLFNFDPKTTTHLSDLVATYEGSKIPISLLASVLFYGYDRDSKGDNMFSTYFELGYTFKAKNVSIKPFAGFSPTKNGFYCDSFNFVNVGFNVSKTVKITDKYSIPTKCIFIINPYQETMNLVVKMTII